MNFKKGYLVIFIISVLGLVFIQYQYLRIGLNLAKVQFSQKMGSTIVDVKEGLFERNELTFLAGKAMTKDDSYFELSLDSVQDAARFFMNDFLKEKLLQNGIKTDFSYRIYSKDSVSYLKSPKIFSKDESINYPFNIDGYLPGLLKKPVILELRFRDINNYFLFQLNGLTIPSILFLIAIILTVFWVLRSFYWQRTINTTTNEFINNLTHELKTPVFSIGIASKILEEKVSEDGKNILGIIRAQTDKLKNQIEKVLELASIESRKEVFSKSKIDLKPLLLKIASEFEKLAAMENVNFNAEITEETMMVNGEPYHLENTIGSLLDNAKKYSGEHARIVLKAYKKNKNAIIEVHDNGPGIAKENQKSIFNKYYRVPTGDLHSVKGYGLGLNYVKTVVKNHRGKVMVKSEIGNGSIFSISIPLV